MRLFDYMESTEADKIKWFDSFKTQVGMRYFGGKSDSCIYLINRLLNMTCRMYNNGEKANIFIDAFTGGGKLALSMPEGWYDTIVMNDLDYGVYSYYKSCKDKPEALIETILYFGSIFDEDLYRFFALNRMNGDHREGYGNRRNAEIRIDNYVKDIADLEAELKKYEEGSSDYKIISSSISTKKKMLRFFSSMVEKGVISNIKLDPLVAGAMTYWITRTTWSGDTDPQHIWSYVLKSKDNTAGNVNNASEKEIINRIMKTASKRVFSIHDRMMRNKIVVENLDYRQLIRKYNGLDYETPYGDKMPAVEQYKKQNKLWYFDPPYHPVTLSTSYDGMAVYELSFDCKMTMDMTDILSGKDESCGRVDYFIKSDYDPYTKYYENIDEIKISEKRLKDLKTKIDGKLKQGEKSKEEIIAATKIYIKGLERQNIELERHLTDFQSLESSLSPVEGLQVKKSDWSYKSYAEAQEQGYIYYEEDLGKYAKGSTRYNAETGIGHEFVWCRENIRK